MIRDPFAPPPTFAKKSDGNRTAPKPAPDSSFRKIIAIENETENFQVKKVDLSLANKLKSLRAAKEWTQKDLAQRASVRPDVVRDYENGKAIPDPKIIAKFEKALGVPLRDQPAKSTKPTPAGAAKKK